jgi:hypothetical protein
VAEKKWSASSRLCEPLVNHDFFGYNGQVLQRQWCEQQGRVSNQADKVGDVQQYK